MTLRPMARFVLADWAAQPLRLVGMLVQEDFYLCPRPPGAAKRP